jgi:hypothetical protein
MLGIQGCNRAILENRICRVLPFIITTITCLFLHLYQAAPIGVMCTLDVISLALLIHLIYSTCKSKQVDKIVLNPLSSNPKAHEFATTPSTESLFVKLPEEKVGAHCTMTMIYPPDSPEERNFQNLLMRYTNCDNEEIDDPDEKDRLNFIHIAAKKGFLNSFKNLHAAYPRLLNSKTTALGRTPLHLAVLHGRSKIITYIINCFLTSNVLPPPGYWQQTSEFSDGRGETPLHLACRLNSPALVSLFVINMPKMVLDAFLEKRQNDGLRPIDIAMQNKDQLSADILTRKKPPIRAIEVSDDDLEPSSYIPEDQTHE